MNNYVKFILNWPKLTILLFIIVTVILSTGIPKLGFNNSIEALMPHRDKEYHAYQEIKKIYGNNDNFHVMSVFHKDLWSRNTFQKINSLLIDLEEYKNFDEAKENKRIEKLRSIIAYGPVSRIEIMENFKNDLTFQRLLMRKIENTVNEKEDLSSKDLLKIEKKILSTYELKRAEPLDRIISPFTVQDIEGHNDVLEVSDMIKTDDNGYRILPRNDDELRQFKSRLLKNPAFENGLFTKNPKTDEITDFGILVQFKNIEDYDPIEREVFELEKSHKELTITSFGAPYINMVSINYIKRDLATLLPFILLTIVIVFYFNFKSLRGVVLPFLTINMTTIWIMGLMGHLGCRLTFLGNIIPSLMVAVGSSYSIHILNQYYADFDLITQKGKKEGLRLAMAHISVTVLLAGATTCFAFFTLYSSQISAIKEWGFFTGAGVFAAVLISVSIIPCSLVLMDHKRPRLSMTSNKRLKTTIIDSFVTKLTYCSVRHPKAIISIISVIVIVSIFGMFQINVENEIMLNFDEHSEIRKNEKIITEKFGGGTNFCITIDSVTENGALETEFLNYIEDFRNYLVSEENIHLNIGRTEAFSDFLKTMHMAMNNNDKAYYRVPESKLDILDYMELFSGEDKNNDGRIDVFEPFINETFSECHVTARVGPKSDYDVGTKTMAKIKDAIKSYLTDTLPENYTFRITGYPVMLINFCNYTVQGQLLSLMLSLGIVGLIVIFLFNSLKAGFLALIPMSTAVVMNFGIMGIFGINLDMATSIIAAITIGIGVDDTIHFLNTYKYYINRGFSIDETIEKTIAVSGKAILYTSFALIFGFSVLVFSQFKPLSLFSLLLVITMVATTTGALLVLPAVIKVTGIDLRETEEIKGLKKYLNIPRLLGLES